MGNACRNEAGHAAICRVLATHCVVWLLLSVLAASVVNAQGTLDTIREDVRDPSAGGDSGEDDCGGESGRHGHRHCDGYDDCDSLDGWGGLCFYGLMSPYWLPHVATNDEFGRELFFPRYPYDRSPGYLDDEPGRMVGRWGARLSVDYASDFDDLSHIGGRFLLDTTSRWGLDVQMERLSERLSTGGRDHLSVGDGNVVFRFAQSPTWTWRTGVGVNWLDDPIDTNYGFNFTYGADWFPRKPWVLSATLDWGTLGDAELFRFETSAGVLIRRIETYVGYEYLDIDRTQTSSIVAGLRLWF